jgi:hypothetical protein
MPARLLAVALSLLLAPALGACVKSSTSQGSSESSSDSSASSSRSSASVSGSSSASSREGPYERDVRAYTAQFVLSGGDMPSFQRKLGEIAKDHGITDWEQDEATYEGIGRGLKKAGISGPRLEQLKQEMAGPNPKSSGWIQAGYDAE